MSRFATGLVLFFSSLAWCALDAADAQPPSKVKQSQTMDLVLNARNQLHGAVVNGQGKPMPGVAVSLLSRGNTDWRVHTKTDKQGRFVLQDAVSGPAKLRLGREEHAVRVWNRKLAPPVAKREGLFVIGSRLRAQCHANLCDGCDACGTPTATGGHFGGFFQRIVDNPWIVGVGTAAAIAVPIAINKDDAS